MTSTAKIIAAQLAFQALKPIIADESKYGSDEACNAESSAFELAEQAGIEFDEREFIRCTDEDRMNIMLERIQEKLKNR